MTAEEVAAHQRRMATEAIEAQIHAHEARIRKAARREAKVQAVIAWKKKKQEEENETSLSIKTDLS